MPDPVVYSKNDLIIRAMRRLGVIDPTRAPDPEQLEGHQQDIDDMVSAWQLERRMVIYCPGNQYSLQSGVQAYTIGPGGTFNQVRPNYIDGWSVIPDTTAAASARMEIDRGRSLLRDEWQGIPVKGTTGPYPTVLYYDHNYDAATGYGMIYVYPIPTSNLPGVVLYTPTPFAGFPDATTKIRFAPGFARAIWSNLAIEISSQYPGVDPDQRLMKIASESKGWIKRANFRPKQSRLDAALVGGRGHRYNSYTDE